VSAPHQDDGAQSRGENENTQEIDAQLRERFQQAVAGLEPRTGALEHLQHAVPARRRRRHAALAATAATVFVVSAGVTLAARGTFGPRGSNDGGSNVGNLMTTATAGAAGGGAGHGPDVSSGQDMNDGSQGSSVQPPSSASDGSKPSSASNPPQSVTSASVALAACQATSLAAVNSTQSAPNHGVVYETVTGTAKSACTLTGPPGLTVTDASGAKAAVAIHQSDSAAAPLLPSVPAGRTLSLQPGDQYEFEFAWVPASCPVKPPPTSTPSSAQSSQAAGPAGDGAGSPDQPGAGATTAPPGPPTPSGSATAPGGTSATYSVSYSPDGTHSLQSADFTADCGAAIYLTDYFQPQDQAPAQPGARTAQRAHAAH